MLRFMVGIFDLKSGLRLHQSTETGDQRRGSWVASMAKLSHHQRLFFSLLNVRLQKTSYFTNLLGGNVEYWADIDRFPRNRMSW